MSKIKIGKHYLAKEYVDNNLLAYRICKILDVSEKYIYGYVIERYVPIHIKFSAKTFKEFRCGRKCYVLDPELEYDEKEV